MGIRMNWTGGSVAPRRALVGIALAALALAGSCKKHEGRKIVTSRGEVTESWNPPGLTSVNGVPADQIRSAIQQRLGARPPGQLDADHWKHVQTLYATFGQSPLWLMSDGLDQGRATALTNALLDLQSDAMRLDEYPVGELARALGAVRQNPHPTADQLADADVLLTATFAAIGEDLLTGQIDPKKFSQDWHIATKEAGTDSALVTSLRSEPLDRSLAMMRPDEPGYDALREQLGRFREIVARGGWPTVPAGRALKPGERDDPARLDALRRRLTAEGFGAATADSSAPAAAPRDSAATGGSTSASTGASTGATRARAATGPGVYDHALAAAVAQFQARHGIAVDSMLGAETVQSLNLPAEYRLEQIAANLERYRWLPRSFGARYILVNVPAFRLEAYDSGQKVLEMKVIVGQEYEDKKTPVFSDSMEYVIFRPYWLVTPDIQRKELEPKIAADPDYMARNDYEYYTENGKQRIRQKPGDKNSLGMMKFMFPNDFNIYLHDTPQHELFAKDVRAFSHGCIRLEKPAELAKWVLGWDDARVQAAESGANNHQVNLPHKIPVYIAYFTAYVRDGQLYFGNDLYARDDALTKETAEGAMPTPSALEAAQALKRIATR